MDIRNITDIRELPQTAPAHTVYFNFATATEFMIAVHRLPDNDAYPLHIRLGANALEKFLGDKGHSNLLDLAVPNWRAQSGSLGTALTACFWTDAWVPPGTVPTIDPDHNHIYYLGSDGETRLACFILNDPK